MMPSHFHSRVVPISSSKTCPELALRPSERLSGIFYASSVWRRIRGEPFVDVTQRPPAVGRGSTSFGNGRGRGASTRRLNRRTACARRHGSLADDPRKRRGLKSRFRRRAASRACVGVIPSDLASLRRVTRARARPRRLASPLAARNDPLGVALVPMSTRFRSLFLFTASDALLYTCAHASAFVFWTDARRADTRNLVASGQQRGGRSLACG